MATTAEIYAQAKRDEAAKQLESIYTDILTNSSKFIVGAEAHQHPLSIHYQLTT